MASSATIGLLAFTPAESNNGDDTMSEQTPIDWSKPAAEILEDLLADIWVPNEQGVTIAIAETALAAMPGAADLVLATFTAAQQPEAATVEAIAKAGRMQSAFIAMSSEKGLLLSTADRQEMIDQLAVGGSWPDEVRDAVKALGGIWVGRWSTEGFDAEPTLGDVQFEQSRRSAIASTADRINAASEARRAAIDNPASTGAEIIAATVEAFG